MAWFKKERNLAGPPIMKELPASGLKKNWQLKVSQLPGVTVADGLAYLMDKPKLKRKAKLNVYFA